MAYFAKLDDDNIVIDVRVIDNSIILQDEEESEELGIQILKERTGHDKWVQTSYNASFRGTFAAIGGSYDEELEIFIPIKPLPSFILSPDLIWIPPVPVPDDAASESNPNGKSYYWDEESISWVEIEDEDDDYPEE